MIELRYQPFYLKSCGSLGDSFFVVGKIQDSYCRVGRSAQKATVSSLYCLGTAGDELTNQSRCQITLRRSHGDVALRPFSHEETEWPSRGRMACVSASAIAIAMRFRHCHAIASIATAAPRHRMRGQRRYPSQGRHFRTFTLAWWRTSFPVLSWPSCSLRKVEQLWLEQCFWVLFFPRLAVSFLASMQNMHKFKTNCAIHLHTACVCTSTSSLHPRYPIHKNALENHQIYNARSHHQNPGVSGFFVAPQTRNQHSN